MTCWSRADVRQIWQEGQSLEGREVRSTIIITIAFQLLFTAFNALQNLHSSLHDEEFLGLTCLAIIYGTATVSSILAPAIIARVGAKAVLVMSFGAHCLYILANLYPSFASMAPVAVVLGFFHGPAWTCQSLYVTACAFSYSKRASSSPYSILSRFNSLFFGVLATTQIAGNLVTSTVIRDGVGNISETIVYEFCGANDCPANENATEIHDPATWVIDTTLGVLLGCALLGLVLVVLLLIPLPRNELLQGVTLRDRLLVYFRVVMTTNMILLAPFMLFSSVQHAFLVSVFTKAYVACPIGIHNVGFVMASYGATTPVFMAIFGQLARVTGRFLLLVASLVTNLILLVILFTWAPTAEDEAVMYIVAIVWGLAESILLAQANALIAMLYPEDKEAAFANFHAWRSLGYTVSFANSTYLCVSTKLVLCILLVCLALVLYVFVEIQAKVQEHRNLKPGDHETDIVDLPEGDDDSGPNERPLSTGTISTISLQYLQARKSFDFVELSEIIKEAQSGWTRERDSLKLDLPKVMSREHLQHSKVTTWFHTMPLAEDEMVNSMADPYSIGQTLTAAHGGLAMQRSISDSNLKSAMSGGKRLTTEPGSDQLTSRYRSAVFGQITAPEAATQQARNGHLSTLTAGVSNWRQKHSSVFKKFKESAAARKRLSLQIPVLSSTTPGGASPSPRVGGVARTPSSGYGSEIYPVGSRSPVAGIPGGSTAVENLPSHSHFFHRHSLDATTLARVCENITPLEAEPVVTFHLGSTSPDVESISVLPFNTRRQLSQDVNPALSASTAAAKKSGLSKVIHKVTKRYSKGAALEGITNVTFSHAGERVSIEVGSDRQLEAEAENETSDVDSDGFIDDDEDDDETFEDPTLPKTTNPTLSTVMALRKKKPRILSQTEDVSSIY